MFSKTSTFALVSAAILAASAPAVVDASAKRGVAWPYFSNVAASDAFGGAVAWLYDYETYLPPPQGSSFAGKEFICMQGKRGTGAQDSSPIAQLATRCSAQGSYVMGFNEPDQQESVGGSAISPGDAANLWKQYIQPLKNQGKKLVAPSVSAAQGDGLGQSWLDQFVAACGGCTFDAYGFHPYGPNDGIIRQQVDSFTSKYSPAWIDEFGQDQNANQAGPDFFNAVIAYLEGNGKVERYATLTRYNPGGADPKDLLNTDGSRTELGNIYNS